MPTAWTYPSLVIQYPEPGAETEHVAWDEINNFISLKQDDGRSIQTVDSLFHIARSPKYDLRNKTYFLKCTGFNFKDVPVVISGIEVRLTSRRYGRAQDDTIQLCFNGELVGENLSTPEINPIKIYGGNSDLWGTTLTRGQIIDSSFGFIFRFQAHKNWPHRDPVLVDAVEMRIH